MAEPHRSGALWVQRYRSEARLMAALLRYGNIRTRPRAHSPSSFSL
ncbi:MAG: hypothetical protein JST22_20520 [Bacteroidetes bacterium]|nr:hypothetical protein [Bacteroidota bacterium]